jgi:hypothetical protein
MVALMTNPVLESLSLCCSHRPKLLNAAGAALWTTNTHLLKCTVESLDSEPFRAVTLRNRAMVRHCREAVMTLLAIRKYCKLDAGWTFIPSELVRDMAQYLWSTRGEWCWNRVPLEPNPYTAL